jgi:hypothetical protein
MQNLVLWNLIQSGHAQALAERTSTDIDTDDSQITAIYDFCKLLIAIHPGVIDDEDSENILNTVCYVHFVVLMFVIFYRNIILQ